MSVVAREDAIDFPCSPAWVRHYAAKGLTTGYPAEMDYRAPVPPPPPVPDPFSSIQQYRRYYHMDLAGMGSAQLQRELRIALRYEDADDWFTERILGIRAEMQQSRETAPEPSKPQAKRKGIEI